MAQSITNISQPADQTAFSARETTEEITKVADEAQRLGQIVETFTVHPIAEEERASKAASVSGNLEMLWTGGFNLDSAVEPYCDRLLHRICARKFQNERSPFR